MKPKKPPELHPPEGLDAEAQARWRAVVPALVARGAVDTELLATYCRVWVRWTKAEATLAKTGPLVKNARGGAAANPLLSVERQAGGQVRALEKRLGIGEAPAPESEPEDPPAGKRRPGLFTRPELAEAFAVHQQTVTKWERDGLPIEIRGSRGRPTYYSLADCVKWRIERELIARGVGSDTLSPQNERALLDRVRREEVETRMRRNRGELVEVDAVRLEYVELATAVKARLRAIPDATADQLIGAAQAGPAAVRTLLLDRIDEALRELARGSGITKPVAPPAESKVA